jgi:dTDP-D-glucose 4,6-dehydratase
MKLLVTGGAGCIGANFVRYVLGRHALREYRRFYDLWYGERLN